MLIRTNTRPHRLNRRRTWSLRALAGAVAVVANGAADVPAALADTVSVPPPCDVSRAVTETVRDQVSGTIKRGKSRPGASATGAGKAQAAAPKTERKPTAADYAKRLAAVEKRIARADIRNWVTAHVHQGPDSIGIAAGPKGVTVNCPLFFAKWTTQDEQLKVLLFESGKALHAIVKEKADLWRETHASESPETQAFAALNSLAADTSSSAVRRMWSERGGEHGAGVDPVPGGYENVVGVLFRELALTKTSADAAKPTPTDDPVAQLGKFIDDHPLSSSLMRAR